MTALGDEVEVLRPGPLATVQDLGRPGFAHLGVARSGAADARSLRLANRLVGNPPGLAAIEVTMGGLALRFGRSARVAVTGAPCPVLVGGHAAAVAGALSLVAGEVLQLGPPAVGLRSYVAVAGGVAVPAVLGSRSTDTLSGLGPAPLNRGMLLPLGPPPADPAGPVRSGEVLDVAPQPALPAEATLRVVLGPRDDWFTPEAIQLLGSGYYTVSAQCDRIGMRLDGPALARRRGGELASEATVLGALQVPPGGRPILFLPDHPVTGGYPVIAVVVQDDVARAAQLRPGSQLRFRLA